MHASRVRRPGSAAGRRRNAPRGCAPPDRPWRRGSSRSPSPGAARGRRWAGASSASGTRGSSAKTSSAAPPRRPSARSSTSAGSSTSDAARDVDQRALGAERLEHRARDDAAGRGRAGRDHDEPVDVARHGLEVGIVVVGLVGLRVAAVIGDAHPHRLQPPGDLLADAAEAEDAGMRPGQLAGQAEAAARPAARPHVGVRLRDAPAERRASARAASSATASFSTSGVLVTRTPRALQAAVSMRVVADAVARHDLEPRQRRHDLGRDRRSGRRSPRRGCAGRPRRGAPRGRRPPSSGARRRPRRAPPRRSGSIGAICRISGFMASSLRALPAPVIDRRRRRAQCCIRSAAGDREDRRCRKSRWWGSWASASWAGGWRRTRWRRAIRCASSPTASARRWTTWWRAAPGRSASLGEMAAEADVIVLCVTGSPEVEATVAAIAAGGAAGADHPRLPRPRIRR